MKQQGQPKRHHFIPKFIIKNFYGEDNKTFYFEKKHKTLKQKVAKSIFYVDNLYSIFKSDNTVDPSIETAFSPLETHWAELFREIVDIIRNGKHPIIKDGHRDAIQKFLYYQSKRTPHRLDAIDAGPHVDAALEEFRKRHPHRAEEAESLVRGPALENIVKSAKAYAVAYNGGAVLDIMSRKDLVFLSTDNSKRGFVLGSSPLRRFGVGSSDLRHSTVELSMPIAPDVVVGLAGMGGAVRFATLDDSLAIRRYNEDTAAESEAFIGQSEKLVRSLADPYMK